MNTLRRNACDKTFDRSYGKSLFLPPLACTALLPQLRGEWVRKGVEKERKGRNRQEQSKEGCQIPSESTAQSFECSRTFTPSVTAPCGALTHPSSLRRPARRLRLLRERMAKGRARL
jgi:hypothetical protein